MRRIRRPRMAEDFPVDRAKRRKCTVCGVRHIERFRRPLGVCLSCDLHDRRQAGAAVEALAQYTDLPGWLLEVVL